MPTTVVRMLNPPADAVMLVVVGTLAGNTGVQTTGVVSESHFPAQSPPVGVISTSGLLELNVMVCVNTWPPLEFKAWAKTLVTCPGVSEMLGFGKMTTWVTVTAAFLSALLLPPPPHPVIRATRKMIRT